MFQTEEPPTQRMKGINEHRPSKTVSRWFSSVRSRNHDLAHLKIPQFSPSVDKNKDIDPQCLEYLESFITEPRRMKISEVLANRTDRIRVVLEDIFQPHNASAVMRSCECFGVQHLHIIENRYAFSPNSEVSMGSNKWVSLHRHRKPGTDNTRECLSKLKDQGFQIVATALSDESLAPSEISVDRPVALCFGTEEDGLSETALSFADSTLCIPMFGFTQSFNISVSVAICLYDLCGRLRREHDDWHLSGEEMLQLRQRWIRNSLKNPDAIERRYAEDNSAPPA